ncbi:hypothetical protein VM1G_01559 [Cytospora mali]|uniref:Uncharacterized protein n=1 Tax=Cytospora mali TaxID=578113 RepID=A0A194VRC7_CYTMA|nr:hypothetical protein VM1G_01559 [Valsa mali]
MNNYNHPSTQPSPQQFKFWHRIRVYFAQCYHSAQYYQFCDRTYSYHMEKCIQTYYPCYAEACHGSWDDQYFQSNTMCKGCNVVAEELQWPSGDCTSRPRDWRCQLWWDMYQCEPSYEYVVEGYVEKLKRGPRRSWERTPPSSWPGNMFQRLSIRDDVEDRRRGWQEQRGRSLSRSSRMPGRSCLRNGSGSLGIPSPATAYMFVDCGTPKPKKQVHFSSDVGVRYFWKDDVVQSEDTQWS